jgi:NitT/TauT family transport system permease protein
VSSGAAVVESGLPAAAPDSVRDERPRLTAGDIAGPGVVFALFVAIWYLLSLSLLPPQKRFLLPPPHEVITDGFLVWRTGERRGLQPILASVGNSAQIALIGLVITIVVGMGLAVLMSMRSWLEKATWPYLVAIQSAPILALTPLIRALVDGARTQRLLVVVLIAIFPVVSNTLFGLLSADRSQHELFTLQGASRWTRMRKLQLPAALPNIFVGLRISAGLAVIGAVVGDIYFRQGGTVGVGAQIDLYRSKLWGAELIAAIVLASALGLVVFLFFGWLSRRVIGKWHVTNRGH